MGWMQQIINDANSIGNSLVDIRTEANEKGAGIAYGDNLNTWADKIRNISVLDMKTVGEGNPLYAAFIKFGDTFTYPTKDENDNPFNLSFTALIDYRAIVMQTFEKIIVPEYFTSVSLPYLMIADTIGQADSYICKFLKEIEIGASSVTNVNSGYWPRRQFFNDMTIKFTKSTGAVSLCALNNQDHFTQFIAPKAVDIWLGDVHSSIIRELKAEVPSATRIYRQMNSHTNAFQYVYGNLYFPLVSTVSLTNASGNTAYGSYPYSGSTNKQVFRLPALTSVNATDIFTATTVKNELWVGPNLSSVNNAALTNWKNGISAGTFEIHIPSGESTTKTYFDNNGVSYIQDYDTGEYASDLEV